MSALQKHAKTAQQKQYNYFVWLLIYKI